MSNRESKISDDALSVNLHENVLRLQVAMRDRRLSLLSEDLSVQMYQAAGDREANVDHLVVAQWGLVQVIVERSELVVMSDQPELRARVPRRHVGANVPKNVFVSKQDGAVDFGFTLPGLFITAEEDFDRDVLSMPNCAPNFAIATTTNALGQCNLSSQGPLDQKRQSASRS